MTYSSIMGIFRHITILVSIDLYSNLAELIITSRLQNTCYANIMSNKSGSDMIWPDYNKRDHSDCKDCFLVSLYSQRGSNSLRSRRGCWNQRVSTMLVKARNSSRNSRSWLKCTRRMNSNYTGLDHEKSSSSTHYTLQCLFYWKFKY